MQQIAVFVLLILLAACSDHRELAAFTSDGCSLFPDSSPLSTADWCECCFQHDIAYWRGGTIEQRKQADNALKQCVLEKTGNGSLANLMYEGVRFGGSPYFPNWYRWGYGWGYSRKYQTLSELENATADRLLQKYFEAGKREICPASL